MNMRISHRLLIAATSVLLCGWSQANEIRIRHAEDLQQFEMQSNAVASKKNIAEVDTALLTNMRFNAFGKHFDLELAPNRSLLQQLDAQQRPTNVGVYRGTLKGNPDSWVRLVFDGKSPSGLINDGKDTYAVEESSTTNKPVVFLLDDLEIPPHFLSCDAIGVPESAAQLLNKVSEDIGSQIQAGPGATQNLNIAVIADFEFTSDKGAGNAASAMIARMNNVDGIFSSQFGVQLTVNRTDTFSSSDDPFSDGTAAGDLLDELTDFRFSEPSQNSNGLTHLFTGRNLDGSTVGVAYSSAICSRRFGAGLTQGTHSVTVDSLIAAHEIGHNFGAPHDGTDGACDATTGDWLMSPRVNGSDQFSDCSISQMQSVVNRASCVSALPSTDVAVTLDEAPATPLLGNQERIGFSVDSVGTNNAESVSVDVSIPGNVKLDSVSATTGTCTSGAATASCTLGNISAGSGSVVTITATLNAVGNAQFVADISATDDNNAANNQRTVNVNVAPAVDLVVTTPASSNLTLDQESTVRVTVENRASIAATGVQVIVSPTAGLRIESASWSNGDCTLNSGDLDCGASNLAAQSTNIITMRVTGTTEGNQSYSVNVSASEADRNTVNNEANGSVSVSAVASNPGGDDDSGGGAIDWLLVGLLSSMFVSRRRRFAA